MHPLIDEQTIAETPGQQGLVLTTHRVRMRATGFGSDEVVSIMLDAVVSCGLVRRSRPALLALAALCVLVGVSLGDQWLALGLIGAVLCVADYGGSRRQFLVLSSAGESIRMQVGGASTEDLITFIDGVEAAKSLRYLRQGP